MYELWWSVWLWGLRLNLRSSGSPATRQHSSDLVWAGRRTYDELWLQTNEHDSWIILNHVDLHEVIQISGRNCLWQRTQSKLKPLWSRSDELRTDQVGQTTSETWREDALISEPSLGPPVEVQADNPRSLELCWTNSRIFEQDSSHMEREVAEESQIEAAQIRCVPHSKTDDIMRDFNWCSNCFHCISLKMIMLRILCACCDDHIHLCDEMRFLTQILVFASWNALSWILKKLVKLTINKGIMKMFRWATKLMQLKPQKYFKKLKISSFKKLSFKKPSVKEPRPEIKPARRENIKWKQILKGRYLEYFEFLQRFSPWQMETQILYLINAS